MEKRVMSLLLLLLILLINYSQAAQTLVVSPKEGHVGDIIQVKGEGFESFETIKLGFGDVIKEIIASEEGKFVVNLEVGTLTYGEKTILAEGTKSGVSSCIFKVRGKLTEIIPSSGQVGTEVRIGGSGFKAGERIQVNLGDAIAIAWATADKDGIFSTTFSVPSLAGGKQQLLIIGTQIPYELVFADFEVIETVDQITPKRGKIGTVVTISGRGFPVGDTISVDFGKVSQIITSSIAKDGKLYINFVVPKYSFGTTPVVISSHRLQKTFEDVFYVEPNIVAIEPTRGSVSTKVSVKGQGYIPGETIVVDFGDVEGIACVLADEYGDFVVDFVVGSQAGGEKTIRVCGLSSLHLEEHKFRVEASLAKFYPREGTYGTTLYIEGWGFKPHEEVRIDLGDIRGIARVKTSSIGSFSVSFSIPQNILFPEEKDFIVLPVRVIGLQWPYEFLLEEFKLKKGESQ